MRKIKSLAIIILMITIIMILSVQAEATTGKINSETVRVRSEATTKSSIVTQLDKGDKIEILEQSEGWYKVTFTEDGKEMTGYISEKLVDLEEKTEKVQTTEEKQPEENENTEKVEEQTEKVEETTNNSQQEESTTNDITTNIEENKEYALNQKISITILPVINSIEVGQIESGNIKTIEIINDWCKIENETETGWIRNNILKRAITTSEVVETSETDTNNNTENQTAPEEQEQEPEKPSTEQTVIKTAYVSTESLKVRKEANTSSEVIDSLKKNAEVSIIEELDGWYKIKISGEIGYVSSKYISDTKVPETTSRGTDTQRVENVTEIQKETTNAESAETSGTSGDAVVSYAKQYLGYKYVSGGATPTTGFDCSGFTKYVYKNFGVNLNRTSRDQIKNGVEVEKANLQPGDILIFNGDSNKTIGHVGIYIGGGDFIHASNPSDGVKITPLDSSYYEKRYVGARRVI